MSPLGQKLTFRQVNMRSALPPEADICLHELQVRFVPIADISLDPVSATEQGGMIPCKFGEGTRRAAG
jgi:hypothetical protein